MKLMPHSPRVSKSQILYKKKKNNIYIFFFFLLEVGFEPTHPKITELKSAALDHSAIQAIYNYLIN